VHSAAGRRHNLHAAVLRTFLITLLLLLLLLLLVVLYRRLGHWLKAGLVVSGWQNNIIIIMKIIGTI